ncbi:MAG: fructosamine kinase family protein [Chloroflexota bacterium]
MKREQIQQHFEQQIASLKTIAGGVNATIYRIDLIDGQSVIVKASSQQDATLHIEGKMLQYLANNGDLPVPNVLHSEPQLLIMRYINNHGRITPSVEEDAARHLATLHNVTVEHFGLPFDTLIGGLHQPNTEDDSWIDFFREQRLLYMAQVAYEARQLPLKLRHRIERFATALDDLLIEPEQPSLIHGDMWGGNVLVLDGKIAGFIDPAIYYAHPEIELAFSTLFNTFGQRFFDVYTSLRPLEPEFFSVRRDIYNLYPLLVHVRLFGGGYVSQVDRILKRFGY